MPRMSEFNKISGCCVKPLESNAIEEKQRVVMMDETVYSREDDHMFPSLFLP